MERLSEPEQARLAETANTVLRKAKKPPSRGARWSDAVAGCRAALNAVEEAVSSFHSSMAELAEIQGEFQEWRDNLPENLQGTALGEKLNAVADLDLEEVEFGLDEATTKVDEAEGADLPLGFGRD